MSHTMFRAYAGFLLCWRQYTEALDMTIEAMMLLNEFCRDKGKTTGHPEVELEQHMFGRLYDMLSEIYGR